MYLDWVILHYSFRRRKMIDKIKENWEKILLILKEEHEVSDVSYRTWLQPLTPYAFKGNTVTIIVPEQTFLAYVKKKYGLLLQVTISEFLLYQTFSYSSYLSSTHFFLILFLHLPPDPFHNHLHHIGLLSLSLLPPLGFLVSAFPQAGYFFGCWSHS